MTNDHKLDKLRELAVMAPVRDEQWINALIQAIRDNVRRAEADRDSQQRTAVKTIMRDHKLLVLIAGTTLSVIIAIANF